MGIYDETRLTHWADSMRKVRFPSRNTEFTISQSFKLFPKLENWREILRNSYKRQSHYQYRKDYNVPVREDFKIKTKPSFQRAIVAFLHGVFTTEISILHLLF